MGLALQHHCCSGPWMKGLRAVGAVGEGGVFVGPGRGRLEGEPAVFTTRVLAVRHALEGKNAASEGRARRGDGAGLLVDAGRDAVRAE
jgi:hypothetical protein